MCPPVGWSQESRFLRGKIIVKLEIVMNRTLRVGQMKIKQIIQLYLPFTKLVLSLFFFFYTASVCSPPWQACSPGWLQSCVSFLRAEIRGMHHCAQRFFLRSIGQTAKRITQELLRWQAHLDSEKLIGCSQSLRLKGLTVALWSHRDTGGLEVLWGG